MAGRIFAKLTFGVFAPLFALAHGHAERTEFMEISVRNVQSGREQHHGEPHQAIKSQFARTDEGALGSGEENGSRQLMLGFCLIALFAICMYAMHETEESEPKPSPKRAARQPSPASSPLPTENLPFPDEATLLLDDIHRQEDLLKRQEEEAWRRQEEAVRIEKQALLRREEEIRARYERMESLHPKPLLYIQASSPVPPATTPSLHGTSQTFQSGNSPPRTSPLLFEPYAAREARERREALEAAEHALVESSPTLAGPPSRDALEKAEQALVASDPMASQRRPVTPGSPPKTWSADLAEQTLQEGSPTLTQQRPAALGSPPKTWEPPASYVAIATPSSSQTDTRELRSFQAQWETYEQARRDTNALADSLAAARSPATAPSLSATSAFTFPTSPSPPSTQQAMPTTSLETWEEDLSPEQQATVLTIMQQTGSTKEATLRAMKRAREDEETIMRELEARRQLAGAP